MGLKPRDWECIMWALCELMGDWELMTAAIIDMGKRADILGRRVAALLCW